MTYRLEYETTFDAAHRLVGYDGPCSYMHGHTYRVKVAIEGDRLDDLGMLIDFKHLKKAVAQVVDQFDHKMILNSEDHYCDEPATGGQPMAQLLRENPTAENMAMQIKKQLTDHFWHDPTNERGIQVASVTLWETPSCSVTV